jgi:hypothetical protein
MEKAQAQRDSNSDQSPSDHEKHVETSPANAIDRELPDPDAGLSEEERKHIDRKLLWKLDIRFVAHNQPHNDLRLTHQPHSLAVSAVFDQFPRSYEHRQCQNRGSPGGSRDEQPAVQQYLDYLLC